MEFQITLCLYKQIQFRFQPLGKFVYYIVVDYQPSNSRLVLHVTHFCRMCRRSAATVSLECENISMSPGSREWPIIHRIINTNGLPHIKTS